MDIIEKVFAQLNSNQSSLTAPQVVGEAAAERPFNIWIDSPSADKYAESPFIKLCGWISAQPDARIENLVLKNAGVLVMPLKIRPRKDVEEAFPVCMAVGFQNFVDLADLPGQPDLSIHFLLNGQPKSFNVVVKVDYQKTESILAAKREKMLRIRATLQCPTCGGDLLDETGGGGWSAPAAGRPSKLTGIVITF